MQSRVARHVDIVFQHAVASHQRVVRQNAVIAHDGVVRDVTASHQKIIVADPGLVAASRAAVHGHVFTENVVVPNDHPGFFTVEFQVLGQFTQNGATEDGVPFTDVHGADQRRMRSNHAMRTQIHPTLNHHKRPNFTIFTNISLW